VRERRAPSGSRGRGVNAPGAIPCDYLVIGGGAAGCVVARRLAEAQEGRVVLLEAGPSDEGVELVLDLSCVGELWMGDEPHRYDYGYVAEPMARANRCLRLDRARILGGCSSHNDCAFLRPPASDFAAWESAGAAGWGPEDVAPYFARVRERVWIDVIESGNPVSEAFVAAAREAGFRGARFERTAEEGIGWFPLNSRGRRRQSASVAYLHPLAALPANLEVLTEAKALRLTAAGRRVTGAETTRGPIRAAREVILCSGAFDTPKLLMLSGIGPQAHLRDHGVAVLADCPGVGGHLIDHVQSALNYELRAPRPPVAVQYYEACLMATVDPGAPAPDLLFHFGLDGCDRYPTALGYPDAEHACSIKPNVTRARSEGTVRLRSADAADPPVIDPAYFTDPEGYDERVLLAGMRLARRIAAQPAFQAVAARELAPGPEVTEEADLAAYMRAAAGTVFHSAGTCRMGDPADPLTVVGPDLRVKGVEALRVADASVFPSMVSVNICQTVMMIGEKAAAAVIG